MYQPATRLRRGLVAATGVVVLIAMFNVLYYPQANAATPDVIPVVASVAPAADAVSLVPSEATYGPGGGASGCVAPIRHDTSSLFICWQAYRIHERW